MLPHPALLAVLSRVCPGALPGHELHRRALAAHFAGDPVGARRWFTAAAARYRLELQVEPLARLRVHELMTEGGEAPAPATVVEIVRRLNRLDRLETLSAPHALADARDVLAEWMERTSLRAENGGAQVPAAGSRGRTDNVSPRAA